MNWANFGNPAKDFSQNTSYTFLTGTEMQINAPALFLEGETPTANPVGLPFSVRTQAGQAPSALVAYAGVPSLTGVTNVANAKRLHGAIGAADTGGTPIELTGEGFSGQLLRLQFIDSVGTFSEGTQYTFDASSNTSVSAQTVSQNPGLDNVQACTASGCSATSAADLIYLYPPGDPRVESISPASGSAAGATKVSIHGQNLGCATAVFFGEVEASFVPVETPLDCGSSTVVDATSPAGAAGSKVPVTLTTVESFFTGSGRSASSAQFAYRK
jgi:hypothetical protein